MNTLLVTYIMIIELSHYIQCLLKEERCAYVKGYDGQTNWMYFFIEDNDLLEKYNTIRNKVSADIK